MEIFQSQVVVRIWSSTPMSFGQATELVMPIALDSGSQNTEKPYAIPIHRWMARAAGGTSQRLNAGPATVRSLVKKPGAVTTDDMELPLGEALSMQCCWGPKSTAKRLSREDLSPQKGRNPPAHAGGIGVTLVTDSRGRGARRVEPEALVHCARAGPLLQRAAVGRAPVLDIQALTTGLVHDGERRRIVRIGGSDGTALGACTVVGVLLHIDTVGGGGAGDVNRLAAVGIEDLVPAGALIYHRERLGTRTVTGILLHLSTVRGGSWVDIHALVVIR